MILARDRCWIAGRQTISVAFLFSVIAVAGAPASIHAQAESTPAPDLASLDLEELARIRVTSAARKPELVARTAAAISVITREDIRRSGATLLPEALRLVPGLEVARVGTRDWAISARGFNQQSSNKLLVLVDGRTVYSPIFAGVFWDAVAASFDEIDRIEVIRGPGATLWGENAVNGVINIITRPAAESRGGRLTIGGGTRDRAAGSARYGWSLGANTAARVYAAGGRRDIASLTDGLDAPDDWDFGQTGFRVDGAASPSDYWTVQGNAFVGEGGNRLMLPSSTAPYVDFQDDELKVSGGNVIGRWMHRLGGGSDLSVQAHYDYARRRQTPLFGTMTANIAELDVQHHIPVGARHDVVWGFGYQFVSDRVTGAPAIAFAPEHRTTHRVSGFLQDDIALIPEQVTLTLGSKVSHNRYSGFEFQPNARLLWLPDHRQALWGAVSRAVRTPARIDADVRAVAAALDAPTESRLRGSEAFDSEVLTAYELGYRWQPAPRLAFDVALFYNNYERVRTLTLDELTTDGPRPVAMFVVANDAHGRTYGAEAAVTLRAASWWRLRGTYARLEMDVAPNHDASTLVLIEAAPGDNPEHQATLWSSFDGPHGTELDLGLRAVSELEARDIPGYMTADIRAGWRWGRRVDIALVGQDLLHERHREFPTAPFIPDSRAVARRVFAKMTWRF